MPDPQLHAPATRSCDDALTRKVAQFDLVELEDLDASTETDTASSDAPSRARRPSAPIAAGERYLLGEQLGRGGMGEVLAAHDSQIGRDVAIKRMHDDDPSPIALARFLREARIQGRLDHPAIPPVHELDYGSDGRPFFAMKKLAGTTLADILRDPELRRRFSRQRLLRAFADVCLAIEFAHMRGVIHRDLKPSNVLLGDFGEVYVLDWGLARMMEDIAWDVGASDPACAEVTIAGAALGTPGYMAPEQVLCCDDLDERADVYALGCLLFEILTGTPLHPKGDAGMRSALLPVDVRPSNLADHIPPELDELCMLATAVEREDRLGSARELGEAVQHYLDGDRDVELRGRLAREHLDSARDALELRDDEGTRGTAMREAGRALALDPTLLGAAELVGQLMMTPPAMTPRAVVEELDALDVEAARGHARVGVVVHAGYIALALFLLVIGARDPVYIPLLVLTAGACTVLGLYEMRRPSAALASALIAANIAVIALFARMFTPFLVAPGVGVATLMTFAFHPVSHRRTLIKTFASGILAILGVWAAEAFGFLSQTMHTGPGTIFLQSPVDGLSALPLAPSLCIYVITLFVVAAVLSRTAAQEHRIARHRLHVQAWQLRQLLSVR